MVGQTVVALCMLLAGSAQATEAAGPAEFRTPKWGIAPEVSHYRYKEPGVMENEGTLYGVTGWYTLFSSKPEEGWGSEAESGDSTSWSTLDVDGRISAGEVDYHGSYMDGTPLSTSGTDDFLLDVRLLMSRRWEPTDFISRVYAGLGYRYLNDDSSDQPGGYERESNYLYVPVGARKDFELTTRWALALTGEFDVLLIGRQISHLNDADPTLPEVKNWQSPGFGAGLFLDLLRRGGAVDIGLGPFLRYWWVAESDTSEDGFYEPENNTLEYGLSLLIQF